MSCLDDSARASDLGEVGDGELSAAAGQGPLAYPPVVRAVDGVIARAIDDGASDIHIEPGADAVRVRYRVWGRLREAVSFPKRAQSLVASRVKSLASMEVADSRRPQEGRLKLQHSGREFELRVSTLPTIYGDKIAIRILDMLTAQLKLNKLGFYEGTLRRWEAMVDQPSGMVLVTGPIDSGKSTTLELAAPEPGAPRQIPRKCVS